MIGLLQPRPKAIQRYHNSDIPTASNAKGKGRGKSKSKKGSSSANPKWVSSIQMQGTSFSICMRYQSGSCTNSNCRFKHVCAVPKSDGTACGGNHSAKDHHSTPHWPPPEALPVSLVEPSNEGISQTLDSTKSRSQLHDSVIPPAVDDAVTQPSDSMVPPPVQHQPTSIPQSPSSHAVSHFGPAFAMPGRIFTDIFRGFDSPLASAILAAGGQVFRVDILIDASMDIFDNDFYEQLLRFCACGKSAYIACSPCCGEYSRLKLEPGPGPKPLRSPEHLGGLPGLSMNETIRLQDSFLQLSRGVNCLQAGYCSGSYGHLEQPPNPMSWEEEVVQAFLTNACKVCINLPACQYDLDVHKAWLFKSTLEALASMGGVCNHPQGFHKSIVGTRDEHGNFQSKQTAQYPKVLAETFAKIVGPLISGPSGILTLQDAMRCLPRKQLSEPPQAYQDGGGLFSFPDWSYPRTDQSDPFKELRQSFFHMILQNSYHKRLLCHFHMGDPTSPFSDKELEPFQQCLVRWMQERNLTIDWTIREHQPMHLGILQSISKFLDDEDNNLFESLIEGVPTGFSDDIPSSNCFAKKQEDDNLGRQPLSIHMDNWRSSSDRPELTDELVESEVNQGWVEPFNGSIEDAQTRWPTGVAIGRLGIAISDSRDPRLVVHSSICGTNSSCSVREHQALPTSKDVLRTFPLRDNDEEVGGLSLDLKAAHKRVVIRESERGLLGFSHAGRLYFYRVAPFGAIFSAHWWGRLGGFLFRLWHLLIYIKHALWLYVDDFLVFAKLAGPSFIIGLHLHFLSIDENSHQLEEISDCQRTSMDRLEI